MSVLIYPNSETASRAAAILFVANVLENPYGTVGLTYDSVLDEMFRSVRKMSEKGILSYPNNRFYQLSEFVSPGEGTPSIQSMLRETLFGNEAPAAERYIVPFYPQMNWAAVCSRFENDILDHGGLDLSILVLRPDGSLLYNLAGEDLAPVTHVEVIGKEKVISAGMATVMRSKKLIVLALGEDVAEITAKALGGSVSNQIPASYLQLHQDVTFILDEKAASLL